MQPDGPTPPSPPSKPSAAERAILAAAVCGVLAAAAMVAFLSSTVSTMDGLVSAWSRQRGQSLIAAVERMGQSLATTTRDYAVWDEMWDFVASPDPTWAADNLDWLVEHLDAAGVIVLDPSGGTVYEVGVFADGLPTGRGGAIAYTMEQLQSRPAIEVMLYEPSTESLYWLSGSRIVRSDDSERAGASNGALIVASLVDANSIAYLEQVTGVTGVAVVQSSPAAASTPATNGHYTVPLGAYLGPAGVFFAYNSDLPLFGSQLSRWRAGTGLSIAVILLAMAGLLATMGIIAMRPFRSLTSAVASLAEGGPWQPPDAPYREFQAISDALTNAVERQRQAERKEHQRADELRLILDSLPAHIFMKDADGSFATVSQQLAGLFGLTPADMLGKRPGDLFSPDSAAIVERSDSQVLHSGSRVHTEEELAIGGRTYIMDVIKAPVRNEAGELTGLVGMAVDVTEQHQLTEALRQSQKLDAVGQLAGGVAHDFNNVLTTIISGVHLALAQVPADGQLARDLMEIAQAATRASQITRQLLFLSRSHAGEKSAVDANDVVSSLGKMLHRLLGEDIAIDLALSPRAPIVFADRTRLEQVLLNLAINARDAMPKGGSICIRTEIVGWDRVESALADPAYTRAPVADADSGPAPRHGQYLLLTVTDTGSGIAAGDREHVFTLFFTTKQGRGTGLGLSVVRSVVQEHRGHLWFWSEPGVGSSFFIALPLSGQAQATDNPAAGADRLTPGSEAIMIVEDDDAVRLLTERVLTRQGYRVVVAASAAAALDTLAQMPQPPALLLSDVIMPGMSGFELAQVLKDLYPSMRVVLTSGYPGDAIAARGVEGETAILLPKPYSPSILSRTIRNALDSAADDAAGR